MSDESRGNLSVSLITFDMRGNKHLKYTLGVPDDGCCRGASCELFNTAMFSLMFYKISITDTYTCPR